MAVSNNEVCCSVLRLLCQILSVACVCPCFCACFVCSIVFCRVPRMPVSVFQSFSFSVLSPSLQYYWSTEFFVHSWHDFCFQCIGPAIPCLAMPMPTPLAACRLPYSAIAFCPALPLPALLCVCVIFLLFCCVLFCCVFCCLVLFLSFP